MASNPLPYYLKNGEKRYRIAYRKPDHSQGTKRGFKRAKDAKDWAARIEISLNDNDYIDPTSGSITIDALAKTYLEGKEGAVKPTYKREAVYPQAMKKREYLARAPAWSYGPTICSNKYLTWRWPTGSYARRLALI